jgi:hypothetical protein
MCRMLSNVQHVYNDIRNGVEEIGGCVLEVNNGCCCGSARMECKLLKVSEVGGES